MTEWMITIAWDTWSILLEMAPYLLLGFFLAGLLSVIADRKLIGRWLGKRNLGSVVKASLLGVPLPLCSCGVIPVTSSIYRRGASKGAATSFLTSTPQTGVDSILATAGLINPFFAFVRVLVALISGILTGILVDLFEKARPREPEPNEPAPPLPSEKGGGKLKRIIKYGFYTLPQDIGKSLVLGIVLAGLIGALLPENLGEAILGNPWLTYLAVTLIAIPLYVCSTGSIPIAFAIMGAGVSPGAALVFLIAGPATNVATVTTLLNILGRRTIAIYLVSIVTLSWISGWLLDVSGGSTWTVLPEEHHETTGRSILQILSGVGLMLMVAWSYVYPRFSQPEPSPQDADAVTSALKVEGMSCSRCADHVTEALQNIPGVTSAKADPSQNLAWVSGGRPKAEHLRAALKEAGYKFKGFA